MGRLWCKAGQGRVETSARSPPRLGTKVPWRAVRAEGRSPRVAELFVAESGTMKGRAAAQFCADTIVTPARRPGQLPFRSVPLSCLPEGTRTPLKELLRPHGAFGMCPDTGWEPAGPGGSRPEGPDPDTAFQPMVLVRGETCKELLDVSTVLDRLLTSPQRCSERRAGERPASEAPHKVFQQMKAKALQKQQCPGRPAREEPPRGCSTDFILTPVPKPVEQGGILERTVLAGVQRTDQRPAEHIQPTEGLCIVSLMQTFRPGP